MVDGLPLLEPRDLAARKVLAILDRAEARDFTDLFALAQDLGRDSCIAWAKELDGGIDGSEIAVAFRSLGRLDDRELPVPQQQAHAVRDWFEQWTKDLEA